MIKCQKFLLAGGSIASALLLSACGMLARGNDVRYDPVMPLAAELQPATDGAIWHDGHDIPLFENAVARNVGDILTIVLVESTDASKSSSTTTKKASKADLPGPTIAGRPITVNGTQILSAGMGNETSFNGEGASRQSNSLDGQVTVSVVRRLPNGNLLIRGEKLITINQGREFLQLQGIVRSIDILPDNTISSTKVANALITYSGKGAVANASAPGLLARFFNSPRTPF
jgi:flagellar L-ring protein precursor FlgH